MNPTDSTLNEPQRIIADLRRQLAEARAERDVEMRALEERLELVTRAVAEGIYHWDIERNELRPSARLIEIFGFQGRGLTANDWNDLIHPADFERYRGALRDCFRGVTERLDCEYRVRHTDGNYRWIEDRAVPVRDAAGRALRLVGAVTDISERKAAEEALREALEQQTATAEVLEVINSSPGDLGPVFVAMLEKATRLCEAAFGILLTWDGEQFHRVAFQGVPAELMQAFQQPLKPVPGTIADRVVRGEWVICTSDLVDIRGGRAGPGAQGLVRYGARTHAIVALQRDGKLLGAISVYRREVRPFSDKQIALLQNFAAQAVIAMENARLLDDLRTRTGDLQEALEYQTATSDVLKVISRSTFDLNSIFETVVASAIRLCRADNAGIYLNEGGEYRRAVGVDVKSPEYDNIEANVRILPGTGTVVGRAALERRTVHIDDAWIDPFYEAKEAARIGGVHTMLGVPLLREGAPIGVLALARERTQSYSEAEIQLVSTFADQAVIAIENARLITETREALEQQTATAEVLQVINSSPDNLAPVFDAMLVRAIRLCDGIQGMLWMFDGDSQYAAATAGVSPELAEELRQSREIHPFHRRLRDGERVYQIADLAAEEVYRSGNTLTKMAVERAGTRTAAFVALVKDRTTIGSISICRREVRPFSDKQIELIRTFADQAVIAIENARLLDEIGQRQAELRVTFDNMADGVAMFDEDLRLAAWNRNFQQIADLPEAFLAERPTYADYLRILTERGELDILRIDEELSRRLEDTEQELRLERTRPNGQVIEVRRNAVPDGGFVLIYSDITERKRSEAEIRAARDAAEAAYRDLKAAQANLIQAEKMASLGQLTAGIAHEIKNPLNFVNNFAALSNELLDELKETPVIATLDEQQRAEIDETLVMLSGNLEKIAEHGKRADNIVKSMLEHSRGVSGERREVDLNILIDDALNLAYHGARAQDASFNITLERAFDPALARIELAPQEITRVFLNLFGNGFYATTKRTREAGNGSFRPILAVTTRDLGDEVEIKVRDNGTGIAPEIRDKLFQPFFTTKPTGEGTGLGLSISYDIVTQQHGGTITVDSEPGAFTEFTVRLPRH